MPIYEYECDTCHHRLEIIQRFSDKPLKKCKECGGPLHKVLSPPALHFKGTGWYVTDYARAGQKDGKANGNGKPSESSTTETTTPKTESPKSESPKSETKD